MPVGIRLKNKGITAISYNHLNLPTKVTIINSEHNGDISCIYDATGIKLEKLLRQEKSNSIYY